MKKFKKKVINSIIRLPSTVICVAKKSKFSIIGPLGTIDLQLYAFNVQNKSTLMFVNYLTLNKLSWVKYAAVGVFLSYLSILRIKGIGYRVEKINQSLYFKLGHSHPVIITIPKIIDTECEKNTLYFRSLHFETLSNFTAKIRNLRFPDSYKGSGVHYMGEVLVFKEGKKS